MGQYAEQSLKRHYRIVDEEGDDAKPTLLSKVYKAGKDGKDGMSFEEVRDNARAYIVAGSDTTVCHIQSHPPFPGSGSLPMKTHRPTP
jgi:cytochrome P450